MTDTTDNTLPPDAQIIELKIDPTYKDRAFETIKSLVKGNKYNPDEVTLESFEGKILRFSAYTLSTLVEKRTKAIKPGRLESAKKVNNEEGANIEMEKAYRALNGQADLERSVRETIINRKDKGFGIKINNVFTSLPTLKKEFVFFDGCKTCKAQGNVPCMPCNGNGRVTCTRCRGTGRTPCTHCHGAQMVPMAGNANKKVQCPVCHGRGFTGCVMCNQTGYIPCKTCASKGITPCPTCHGTAWNSHLFIQEVEAKTNFYYPKDKLPEKVAFSMEERDSSITEHAIIRIITDNTSITSWKEAQAKSTDHSNPFNEALKNGIICFPILYDVTLPYGHIEYAINGKNYYTFLFGQKAVLTHVSPFLDDLVENGIRKLKDAAQLRGSVQENLKAAGEYRTVKEGIIFTVMSPSIKKAKIKLKSANPLGLSNNAINEIVNNADRALKNITKKPRTIGAIIAGASYIVVFGAYFLTPLRQQLISQIPNDALHILADISVLGASTYIGTIGIQGGAQAVLKKVMNTLLPNEIKTAPPKLGKIIYWNIAAASIAFIAMTEASRHMSNISSPAWYEALINIF